MRLRVNVFCPLAAALLLFSTSSTSFGAKQKTNTYVFECNAGETYVVRTNETEAWVFRPGGSLQLPVVKSEKVETYRNNRFELQIKSQAAQLTEIGKSYWNCHNNRKAAVWERAKLNGVDFRAVGNEPGWILEIQEGSRIVLLTDDGSTREAWSLPKAVTDMTTQTTRWNTGKLKLEISGTQCYDTMSEESFESTVLVFWKKRILRGCGRALH